MAARESMVDKGVAGRRAASEAEIVELRAANRALQRQVADLQAKMAEDEQSEKAVRESEEYYRTLFENAGDAIMTCTLDGTITSITRGVEELLGWSRDEVIGQPYSTLVTPTSLAVGQERTRRALAGEKLSPTFEAEQICKDGRVIVVELRDRFIRTPGGHPVGFQMVCRDITERKRMEEALRESEERYRSLFENANDAIVTFTLDGIVTSVNRGLEVMLGWSREELIGQHYGKFVTPASVALGQERTRRFLAGEHLPSIFEGEHVGKDGRVVPVEVRTRAIRDREGQPIGFQGIYRDITVRKQAEEELQKAKETAEAANRAKSEFLATMSHELRTPLNIILGYTELLLDETSGQLKEAQANSLRRIDCSARELLDLITAVLDLSRLEAGRLPLAMRETQVAGLLQEIRAETQMLQEQTRLAFVWKVEQPLPVLYTDAGKLKIVLKNLIGNAVKFTPQGTITVAAWGCQDGVEFSVTDTGIGIPQEALEVIFEPFRQIENSVTRQYGGTGLGLHIVKRLLDVLGGTVTVESTVGQGSTFRVWIPRLMVGSP